MEEIIGIFIVISFIEGFCFSLIIELDNPYGDFPLTFKGLVYLYVVLKENFNIIGRIIIYILLLPALVFYIFACLLMTTLGIIFKIFCLLFGKKDIF